MKGEANSFIQALAEVCRTEVLAEKWLIAPTLRVGYQWLDRVARSGTSAVNVRVKTLRGLALHFAPPERSGRTFLRGIREERLVAGLFEEIRSKGAGYLSKLTHTEGVTRRLKDTLRDLRLSGVRRQGTDPRDFEIEAKGLDWLALLGTYENKLAEEGHWDYADVLRSAAAGVADDLSRIALVLYPDDKDLSVLERRFLDALPSGKSRTLPTDPPGMPPSSKLRVETIRALGESNEVREVLRLCMEERLPFDDVEIVCSDSSTYVSLVYEHSRRLVPEDESEVPVTFENGIPLQYTRPGRAFLAWLDWIRDGRPRSHVLRMIRDHLIETPADNDLETAPIDAASPLSLLEGAYAFVEKRCTHVNQLDEYARNRLLRQIDELITCLREEEGAAGLDVRDWLARLTRESTIGGEGPRPGRLYVSDLRTGGHSGRKHTFILGLDDTRFPGAGLQDPFLLDGERRNISKTSRTGLPLAAERREKRTRDFQGLLARLRGRVTLSYSCRNLADDSEMFPSPVLLKLITEKSPPASFAPVSRSRCLDGTEWWLGRLLEDEASVDPETILEENFPHLARGLEAKKARASRVFTQYDGYVPEAGERHDPFLLEGPVLSARRLETLGRCPMEYFFKYVLEVEPPKEERVDPDVWLLPTERGELLHDVFREFMQELIDDKAPLRFDQQEERIRRVLDHHVAIWRNKIPPIQEAAFLQEKRELERTVRIFLFEEERYASTARPRYLEAAVGLEPVGQGTPLDTCEPMELELIGGKRIRVRGRVDRIDEIKDAPDPQFYVWDYKTGGTRKFEQGDPLQQGRILQNALYILMAQVRLRGKVAAEARVKGFGFFFPHLRAHGERIQWSFEELAPGRGIMARLCELVGRGCFPFSDDPKDARFSEYASAFGDHEMSARQAAAKLENMDCIELEPFRRLRGYGKE